MVRKAPVALSEALNPAAGVRGPPNDHSEPQVEAFEEQKWRLQASCMGCDPELFYPQRGESTKSGKEVCAGCPVREECLEYALANSERFGIWGGMSERERRKLRRTRRRAQ